jgi:hypothetical protein
MFFVNAEDAFLRIQFEICCSEIRDSFSQITDVVFPLNALDDYIVDIC